MFSIVNDTLFIGSNLTQMINILFIIPVVVIVVAVVIKASIVIMAAMIVMPVAVVAIVVSAFKVFVVVISLLPLKKSQSGFVK